MIRKKERVYGYMDSVLLIILLFLIGFGVYIFLTSNEFYCSANPDKCVCEEWKQPNSCVQGYCLNSDCAKFRKKSQTGLDIADCNNNPREDDKCKCEEWNNETRFRFVFNKVRMAERNVSFDDLIYIAYLNISGYYVCPIPKEIPTFQDCFAYEILENKVCIKSRPKTECEKGNPDCNGDRITDSEWLAEVRKRIEEEKN